VHNFDREHFSRCWIACQLLKRGLPYLAIESPKLHTLVARGLSLRPLARLLSTLSRLLQQAEICFRPILYDARNSHRAFGKQHLALKLGMGHVVFFHKYWTWDKDFLRGKIEMHRSQNPDKFCLVPNYRTARAYSLATWYYYVKQNEHFQRYIIFRTYRIILLIFSNIWTKL
jgi:hypothetical protein